MSVYDGISITYCNILQMQKRTLLPKERKIRRKELRNRRKIDCRTWNKLQNLVLCQGFSLASPPPPTTKKKTLEAFEHGNSISYYPSGNTSWTHSCVDYLFPGSLAAFWKIELWWNDICFILTFFTSPFIFYAI